MRRRFKRIAMLLCVCMMLEPTCSFAQTPESLPEAASVAETSAPETVTESETADGSETADEQDASRDEETTGSESEGSTEAEAESEGTSETEAGTESEEAPETEAETESEGSTETETETESEEVPETEAESEEASEAGTEAESEETSETETESEESSGAETEAESETETGAESEKAPETEAGTESEKVPEAETEKAPETEAESKPEKVPETEAGTKPEKVPETEAAPQKDSAQKAESAPKKETAAEPKELVFACDGDGVSVTARTESGSDIPKDAKLHAEKLKKGSDKYNAAYDKVSKSLDLEEGDRLYFVPFDVYFTDADGGRIEPESGLTEVTMSFGSDPFAGTGEEDSRKGSNAEESDTEEPEPEDGEADPDGEAISADPEEAETEEFAVHILDDGTVEQLDAEISDGEVIFEVGSFSVMGPVKVVRGAAKPVVTPANLSDNECYVVKDGTTLIFTKEEGQVEGKILDTDYWQVTYPIIKSFFDDHEDLRNDIKAVEFNCTVELNGWQLFDGFTVLRSVTGSEKITISNPDMSNMFRNCTALETVDLPSLDTSNVTNMFRLFFMCESLESVNLSGWDTSSVTRMDSMFSGCHALVSVELPKNVSSVTDMSGLFKHCSSLKSLNLPESWEISSVENMSHMFDGCSALTEMDLSGLNIAKVTDLSDLFMGCSSLTSVMLPQSGSSASNLSALFVNCSALTKVENLENFVTSAAENISQMFYGCSALTEVDMSGWNTENVTNMAELFYECKSLKTLDLSYLKTAKSTDMGDFLFGCSDLWEITLPDDFTLTEETAGDISLFLRHANSTGVWVNKADRNGSKWTEEELAEHLEEGGHTAATYIWVHTLTYDLNGGSGSEPADVEVYDSGSNATLHSGEGLQRDGAVFVGWSQDPHPEYVQSKEDETNAKVTEVTFDKDNITVYALWAEDKNRDGIADYDNGSVTITFDINGGDGSKAPQQQQSFHGTFKWTSRLPGTHFQMYGYGTLKWTKEWKKDGYPAKHPAILAGWTTVPYNEIILEDDLDKDGAKLSEKMVNRTTESVVPDTDTTYYAVYAADEDNNGEPDYLEDSLQVEYYANGGRRADGADWLYNTEELFYRCSHHHVPHEEGVVLLTRDQGKEWIERDGAMLLGWSEKAVSPVTTAEEETAAGIITTVTMPGEGNKKVYAVWAEDRNGNDTPDYEEKRAKLTFDINGGDGSGDSAQKDTFTKDVLPGIEFDLPHYTELHWVRTWEKDGKPAEYPAVIAGWSDHPIRDIILEDDVNENAEVHAHLSEQMIRNPHVTVTANTEAVTYYAVYAADENNDKEPDYLGHAEQVEYYANGGTMIRGDWLEGITGLFYRCGHHHVPGEEVTLLRLERGKELIKRDGAVLLGWSASETGLVTAKEGESVLITTFTMPRDRNGKVYAVWAADADGNGKADYEETVNPGGGSGGSGNSGNTGGSGSSGGSGSYESWEPAPEPPTRPEGPDRYLSGLDYPEGGSTSDTSDNVSEQSTVEGWLRDAVGWRYRYADGSVAAGRWERIKDKWYYFNADGYMATGWKQLSGVWYYLDEVNGDMKTGWQLVGGVWYHLDDASGAMDTGWYLDPSSGKWYYLNGSGAMQIGWQLVSGTYYYLNESAKDGRPYGSMYANETTPDGYAVDASGAWIR